jgi:hypothetical protein
MLRGALVAPIDLNPPFGGELANLFSSDERRNELLAAPQTWVSWELSGRQLSLVSPMLSCTRLGFRLAKWK